MITQSEAENRIDKDLSSGIQLPVIIEGLVNSGMDESTAQQLAVLKYQRHEYSYQYLDEYSESCSGSLKYTAIGIIILITAGILRGSLPSLLTIGITIFGLLIFGRGLVFTAYSLYLLIFKKAPKKAKYVIPLVIALLLSLPLISMLIILIASI